MSTDGTVNAGDTRLAFAGTQRFADNTIVVGGDIDDTLGLTAFTGGTVQFSNVRAPAGFTANDDNDRDAVCDSWELNGIPYTQFGLTSFMPLDILCPENTWYNLIQAQKIKSLSGTGGLPFSVFGVGITSNKSSRSM